jgi:hypothetical protein
MFPSKMIVPEVVGGFLGLSASWVLAVTTGC